MAIRSRDFVGIAEGIKNHELSTKERIEGLRGHLSALDRERRGLRSRISYLDAAIAAAYEDTDEDGRPNYSLIANLESQKSSVENELDGVEDQIDNTGRELKSSESELENVMEEKEQTLFEIQERARQTSQNITLASGMYGAYAGVGKDLQNSMQTSFSALSQAANILGGAVQGRATGNAGDSGGRSGKATSGNGTVEGMNTEVSHGLAGFVSKSPTQSLSSASQFTTNQNAGVVSSSIPNFHSGQSTINVKPPQNFQSEQRANIYAVAAFAESSNADNKAMETEMPQRYISEQRPTENSGFQEDNTLHNDSPKVRRGRNEFIDSLIVQDWELGRFSDPASAAYARKCEASMSYSDYLKNSNLYMFTANDENTSKTYIDPSTVYGVRGIEEAGFWAYKSKSFSDYVEMASKIPLVQRMLSKGATVEQLTGRDDIVGACARNYFASQDMEVIKVGDAYLFGDEGRHRFMAALIAGVAVPVHIAGQLEREKKYQKKEVDNNTRILVSAKIKDRIHSFFEGIIAAESNLRENSNSQEVVEGNPEIVNQILAVTLQPVQSENLTLIQRFEAVQNLPVNKLSKEQLSQIVDITISNLKNKYGDGLLNVRLERVKESIHFVNEAKVKRDYGSNYSPGICGYYDSEHDVIKINMEANTSVGDLLATIDHESMHMISNTFNPHTAGGVMNSNMKYGNVGMNEGITELLSIDNMRTVNPDYISESYTAEVAIMERFREICGKEKLLHAYLHGDVSIIESDFNEAFRDKNAFKEFCEDMDILHHYTRDPVAKKASDAVQQRVEANRRIEEKLKKYEVEKKRKIGNSNTENRNWNSNLTDEKSKKVSAGKNMISNKIKFGRDRNESSVTVEVVQQSEMSKKEARKAFGERLYGGRTLQQQAEDADKRRERKSNSGVADDETYREELELSLDRGER